ncbi:hypothetical protein DPX16_1810 [Anabarilius grahami]|uniref:Uncharacterized protein n=1 Tax=Anabarilius grahami TaxID=495550 RepID=A0A3N0Y6T4_ANAGA|nr:hypothetical protein DPX16_1810 [Anabarilius grahami]
MSTPNLFQELVNALRRALTTNPPASSPPSTSVNTAASPSPPPYASPMAKPAPFSGSAEDCNGFILQCSLVLEMQPHLNPDDRAKLILKTTATPSIYQVHSINGRPFSRRRVRSSVCPVQLQVGILHVEQQHLLVLEESTADVILGRPWLEQHNLVISWKTAEILKWGDSCFPNCFSTFPVPTSPRSEDLSVCATSIESPIEKRFGGHSIMLRPLQ